MVDFNAIVAANEVSIIILEDVYEITGDCFEINDGKIVGIDQLIKVKEIKL